MKKRFLGVCLLGVTLLTGCGKAAPQETMPVETTAATQAAEQEESTAAGAVSYAYKTTDPDEWGVRTEDGAVVLTSYNGDETMIQIPSEIDGVAVQAIGDGCFQQSELVAVRIPEGVERIGSGAFYRSAKLECAEIPDTVTSVEESAFAGCEKLKQLELPDGLEVLGDCAFNASGIENIIIPDGITEIRYGTFMLCKELKSVRISERCTELGQQAFFQCEKLTELNIPDTVEKVWNRCFTDTPWYDQYCEEQGGGFIVFGDELYGCGEHPEEEMPRVKVIQPYAFLGVESVKKLVIPDSVEEIDAYAFADCNSLNEVVIPDSVKLIGSCTFYGCGGLQKVVLPDKNYALTEGMFQDCYSLYSVTIPKSATEIPAGCFQSCYSLADFELPEGLTAIREQAFAACLDIEELYLPATITTIGKNAFAFDTYSVFNCEPASRPEGWNEAWCGTEQDESIGTVNWGVQKQ